jgi:SAM-dependent methyltransferase
MDIANLDRALRSVRRVLRPGGWFVFAIGHPCFLAPDAMTAQSDGRPPGCLATRYFEEGFWRFSNPHDIRGHANYHRPLGVYMNSLLDAGFRLDTVDEPRPTTLLLEQQPTYQQVPIFFSARLTAAETRRAKHKSRP